MDLPVSSSEAPAVVAADSFLTLRYRLGAASGPSIIDTFEGPPATITLGLGELSKVLEQRLLGLADGAHEVFELAPGEAFGERSEEMRQWLSRAALAKLGDANESYAVGDVVQFPAPPGAPSAGMAGAVCAVESERVCFDFNHPLAGQAVRFEVQILGVL